MSHDILQALPTIALFGLKLNRFPAALGALAFFLSWVADPMDFVVSNQSLSQRFNHNDSPEPYMGTDND